MVAERDSNRVPDKGSRILVVDDEEIIHASLVRILGRQGHQVDAVLDGQLALQRLEAAGYDLVITDLMMPGMNGIELMEAMQAAHRDVPVVMITGYPTIKTAVLALRLGAVDYLAKPYTRVELMGPVNRALRKGRLPEETPGEAEEAPAEGPEAPDLSLLPGDRFRLREHSWAVFRQDGSMDIGIEHAFLRTLDRVTEIELPAQDTIVEQGFVTFRLKTAAGEEHGAFAPLSGRVVDVNHKVVDNPETIDAESRLIRIIPSRLEDELTQLLRTQ